MSTSSASTSSLKATLIVAHDSTRGIGLNGSLPWKLSKEMKYFAAATTAAPPGKQNAVLMGRTTWDSIPARFRPLKGRLNVVLSTTKTKEELALPEDVLHASSLQEAMSILSQPPACTSLHRVFIIGGAALYSSSLASPDLADRILLTRITSGDEAWKCDTFFPELHADQWKKADLSDHRDWLEGVTIPEGEEEEKGIRWKYEIWVRR